MNVCFPQFSVSKWCYPSVRNLCTKKNLDKVETLWAYGDKFAGLIRSVMTASLKMPHVVTPDFSQKEARVLAVVAKLKLFTAMNFFFNIRAIGGIFSKFVSEIAHRDIEGIGLAGISCCLIVLDTVDQFTTCMNALLPMLSKAPFAFLEAINLPLSFVILGLSTMSRLFQVQKVQRVYRAFQHCNPSVEDVRPFEAKFKDFYADLLNPSQNEERNRQILERYLPKEILDHFETLSKMVRDPSQINNSQMNRIIASITGHFKKKINVEIGNMIVNALFVLAVTLLAMSVATAAPYLVLSGAFICKLAMLTYADCL